MLGWYAYACFTHLLCVCAGEANLAGTCFILNQGGTSLDAEQGFRTPIAGTAVESAHGSSVLLQNSCGTRQWCVCCRPLALAGIGTACCFTYKVLNHIVLHLSISYATLPQYQTALVQASSCLACAGKAFCVRALYKQQRACVFCWLVTDSVFACHGVNTGRYLLRAGSSSGLPLLARLHTGCSCNSECMFASLCLVHVNGTA